jgi:alanine racemase
VTAVATAAIDLGALRHNHARLRRAAPRSRLLAVLKADAYGHGLATVARALSAGDGFAVARCDEAVALRDAGIDRPILVLNGPMDRAEVQRCARLDLIAAVHHQSQVRMLEQSDTERPVTVWLKVNSGMHRLGVPAETVRQALDELSHCTCVATSVGLMTHFANADDREDPYTREQLRTFEAATAGILGTRSLANSAALLGWPETHADWSRPGIALYGVSPFSTGVGSDEGLLPVMTLSTRLIAVNHYPAGAPVGYSGTWRCPRDSRIGVVALGYGDGYPRHAPSGTPVLVAGRRAPLVGRVSMDTVCVDLTDLPEADVGARAVLWGRGLPVEEVAAAAGTIGYELLAGVTPRVKRVAVEAETA